MPFHTNQLGLGKRHWNLETSSAVVEFPPPYLIQLKNKKERQEYWKGTIWCNSVGRLVGKFIHVEVCSFHHYVNFSHSFHRSFHVCFHFQRVRIIIYCEKKINIISSCCERAHFFVKDRWQQEWNLTYINMFHRYWSLRCTFRATKAPSQSKSYYVVNCTYTSTFVTDSIDISNKIYCRSSNSYLFHSAAWEEDKDPILTIQAAGQLGGSGDCTVSVRGDCMELPDWTTNQPNLINESNNQTMSKNYEASYKRMTIVSINEWQMNKMGTKEWLIGRRQRNGWTKFKKNNNRGDKYEDWRNWIKLN